MDRYPVIHSLIAGDALGPLVREDFGLHPRGHVTLIQSGLNDHYALRTEEREWIVRVYRSGWRSDDEIIWELDLLEHLTERDAPVAAAIRRIDGAWFSPIQAQEGMRQVAVFHRAPGAYTHFGGHGRHRVSPADHAEEFGRSMAEIHAAADTFQSAHARFELDRTALIDSPLDAIARFYAHRESAIEELRELVERCHDLLDRADLSTLGRGPIHADMTGGNSTYGHGRIFHFDFDLAGYGPRAYDLGVFYWSMSINGHGSEVWEPFLRGYASRRPLLDSDLFLVPAFAGIRELWLMGLRCAMAPLLGSHTLHEDALDRSLQRLQRFYGEATTTEGS